MATRKAKSVILLPESVKKPSGLKKDGTPNVAWRDFSERLNNFDQIQIDQWEAEEILGYILKRYKDHYDINFSLSFSGPPSKCGEIYCVRRMMQTVGSQRGSIIKEYIDWVFDTIIIPKKMSVTTLAFFFTLRMCNEFKSIFKKRTQITKSTDIPSNYQTIISNLGLSINTYGDLAFVKMALDKDDSESDSYDVYRKLFSELREIGFDECVLNSM
jgi:hypothetical protein